MALSITDIDKYGRLTPKGENVIIPAEGAGIGDLIYKYNATDFIVIAKGTATADTKSWDGKTYGLHSCIYAFDRDYALIVAPDEWYEPWCDPDSNLEGIPLFGTGKVLLRNGQLVHAYAQMNTAQNSLFIVKQDLAYPDVLYSAYESCGPKEGFTPKVLYKTWDEYIRQTLRVNGAAESPFGACIQGVTPQDFGRYISKTYASRSTFGTALYDCNNYQGRNNVDKKGEWWLPSMYELGELMIDGHLNPVNANKTLLGEIRAEDFRWSCLLCTEQNPWFYSTAGMSCQWTEFTTSMMVRPVSRLKLH